MDDAGGARSQGWGDDFGEHAGERPAWPTAGSDTCEQRRTLNPAFVEALMGWPTGWTDFGSVATACSHWLLRMRSELWRLNCWPMDEVAT